MKITVVAGGVGGSRFLLGVRSAYPDADITAIVNVGDDMWHVGVRIAPDLDTIMYTLAGQNDTSRGWGRVGESERVAGELRAYGVGWPWFTLGDLDLGTHLARTHYLRSGLPLSSVVPLLTSRWDIGVTLLPSTDSEVETHVVTDQGTMHFQEWWTRHRAALPALAFDFVGVSSAVPAPGVLAALADADVVLLAPSNPVVSIGAILAIPGMTPALRDTSAPVVGVSPIISGAVVRGMADACLTTIGVETSASAVALHYGARSAGGVIDGWLVDTADDAALAPMTSAGITARAVPLWLSDDATRAQVARDAVELALSL
ncbi:MAG: 2-phospho-L-lactate transferase [Microbacteriaceae bacterium]|nr:2-phospho-L-lactate transferase [Microbacteriaceae bacterium]